MKIKDEAGAKTTLYDFMVSLPKKLREKGTK